MVFYEYLVSLHDDRDVEDRSGPKCAAKDMVNRAGILICGDQALTRLLANGAELRSCR
jgi:hypothetical protein